MKKRWTRRIVCWLIGGIPGFIIGTWIATCAFPVASQGIEDTYISRWAPDDSFADSAQLILRGYATVEGDPDPISVAFLSFGDVDCTGGAELELTWTWRSNAQDGIVYIHEAPYTPAPNITWNGFADVPALLKNARCLAEMWAPDIQTEPMPMTVRLPGFDASRGLIISLVSVGSVEYAFASSESDTPPRLVSHGPATTTWTPGPTATWEPTSTSWPSPSFTVYLTPIFTAQPTEGSTATPAPMPSPAPVEILIYDSRITIEHYADGKMRIVLECEPR